jgi:hypothetical protein
MAVDIQYLTEDETKEGTEIFCSIQPSYRTAPQLQMSFTTE